MLHFTELDGCNTWQGCFLFAFLSTWMALFVKANVDNSAGGRKVLEQIRQFKPLFYYQGASKKRDVSTLSVNIFVRSLPKGATQKGLSTHKIVPFQLSNVTPSQQSLVHTHFSRGEMTFR